MGVMRSTIVLGKLAFSLIQSASFVSRSAANARTASRSTLPLCWILSQLNAVNGGAPDCRRRRYASTMMPIALEGRSGWARSSRISA